VKIDKSYEFEGPDGKASLLDLFDGRRQLVIQHFMWLWDEDTGCPSCTAASDEISAGLLEHLHARDTSLVVVSRGPIDKVERYKASRGWTFPFFSSYGSDFNYDFNVTIDSSVTPVMWNFRTMPELEEAGMGWLGEGSWEQPGYSMFLRDGDEIFHSYSVYARGTEMLGGSYYFLDLTALGRQEDWEEPKGRAADARAGVPDFST
jgi:predicted dithiol-disulfide oxidoreductase (DUF899 family)